MNNYGDFYTLAEKLRGSGYSCYRADSRVMSSSCFIVTPYGSILCVEKRYHGGWGFTFLYRPSKKNGSGCACFSRPVSDLSVEMVIEAEESGRNYALDLSVTFYSSPAEWFSSYWNKENLVEV